VRRRGARGGFEGGGGGWAGPVPRYVLLSRGMDLHGAVSRGEGGGGRDKRPVSDKSKESSELKSSDFSLATH
jgi:hypothetical protein